MENDLGIHPSNGRFKIQKTSTKGEDKEEEPQTEDPCVDEDERRNRNKDRYLSNLRQAGQLPDWFQTLYDKHLTRGQRTELVNKTVKKEKGRYKLAAKTPEDLASLAPTLKEELRRWACASVISASCFLLYCCENHAIPCMT